VVEVESPASGDMLENVLKSQQLHIRLIVMEKSNKVQAHNYYSQPDQEHFPEYLE
jgi:hypothetical protein